MDLKNKRVLVVGSGLSGIAAVKLLHACQAKILLFDGNERLTLYDIRAKLPDEINVEIVVGSLDESKLDDFDLAVLSPGVPLDIPLVEILKRKRVTVWGEVELAYQVSKGKIAAITGTNGKTTTTALTGEIMKTFFRNVFVVGNIGAPYTGEALNMPEDSVTVAEMSSFQLETICDFKPNVSAVLNISPDHLNRHHTMDNYIKAKLNITRNQTEHDVCVLNYEDEILRKCAKKIKAKVVYFSSARKLDEGVYLENRTIICAFQGKRKELCRIDELKLLGTHNYENVMASVAIAVHFGVPYDDIKRAVVSFEAVEHRIEYVAEKNGVKYYNDSKGTNPDAAIKGIKAMTTPTVLIGGGYDKGSEYDEWIKAFDGKVTYLVLLGQTKEKIARTAKKYGIKNIVLTKDLEEAVQVSSKLAKPGESVLLSPACASWGMFKSYEERGKIFKELVHKL